MKNNSKILYDKQYFDDIDMNDLFSYLGVSTYKGRFSCPNKSSHRNGDRNPSAGIIPKNPTRWHCFACGESGGAVNYIMKYNNCSYFQALQYLYQTGLVPKEAKISKDVTTSFGIPEPPVVIKVQLGIKMMHLSAFNDVDIMNKSRTLIKKVKDAIKDMDSWGEFIKINLPDIREEAVRSAIAEREYPYYEYMYNLIEAHNAAVDRVGFQMGLPLNDCQVLYEDDDIDPPNTPEPLTRIFYDEKPKDFWDVKDIPGRFKFPDIPEDILEKADIKRSDLEVWDYSDQTEQDISDQRDRILDRADKITGKLSDYLSYLNTCQRRVKWLLGSDISKGESLYIDGKFASICLIIDEMIKRVNDSVRDISEMKGINTWDPSEIEEGFDHA